EESTDRYIEKYIVPQMEKTSEELYTISSSAEVYRTKNDTNKENNIVSQPVQNEIRTEISLNSYEVEEEREDNVEVIGEVFSTYILCRTDEELIVIDKHAAHERLLYERLKKNTKRSKQMLLVPATVKLSASEKAAVIEDIALLEEQGFEIDDFGTQGVIVRAIPMYITSEDPAQLVSESAYNLANGNKAEISEKLDWIFHSVACRSAIKAGDKAEITRLTQLVKDIRAERIPLYCPHGRPVIISITKKELEKQFGR
ncbi:MAG: DNA mismatch repair protein MutL, partial [Oscillospiraceae bacterium]|nr:DNA mismatch repair protein MutL [Oscillospiraceae bacterium]